MTNDEGKEMPEEEALSEGEDWDESTEADIRHIPEDEEIPVEEEVSVANVETLMAASKEEDDEDDEDLNDEEAGDSVTEYTDPLDKLFFVSLKKNVRRGGQKLRVHLPAPILIRITRSAKEYTIDWSAEDLVVSTEVDLVPACTIEISEADLLDIVSGELNPQVAMLSDKVRIEGKMGMAIYVFNLFVRKSGR